LDIKTQKCTSKFAVNGGVASVWLTALAWSYQLVPRWLCPTTRKLCCTCVYTGVAGKMEEV